MGSDMTLVRQTDIGSSPRKRSENALWPALALIALPAFLAIAAFANTVAGAFVYDDNAIVRENPTIRDLGNAGVLLTSTYWEHTGRNSGLYRPGTILTYALNYAAGGLNPAGYHAVNVIFHALNTVLVALLVWHLARSATVGSVAGILFAVHPIHVEAVANVVGRAELLSAFFVLLALLMYIAASRSRGRRRLACLFASVVSYGLGLFCKENAITFLAVPLLYDVVYRGAHTRFSQVLRSRWPSYLGFAGVTLLYLCMRHAVVGSLLIENIPRADNPLVDATIPERLLTPFAVAARYLWLMLWPVNLAADYGVNAFPLVRSILDPRFILGVLFACILGVTLFAALRRSKAVVFLILYGLCTYAVASNTVVLIGSVVAERLFYLVSTGLCGLAAIGLCALAERVGRTAGHTQTVALAAALVLAVPLTCRTYARNCTWRSDYSLFTTDVGTFPQNAELNLNAGLVLAGNGEFAESIHHFQRAVRICPENEQAFICLGKAYGALGNRSRKREIYQQAVLRFGRTRHTLPAIADLHMEAGEYEKAVEAYEQAGHANPHNDRIRADLGRALSELRRYGESAVAYREALALDPHNHDALERLALLEYKHLGEHASALQHYEQLMETAPDHPRRKQIERLVAVLRRRLSSGSVRD